MRQRLLPIAAMLTGATLLPSASSRSGPKFYDDDPIRKVEDTQDAAGVQSRDLSLGYNALLNLFSRPGTWIVGRAESVNTIDEVPDSAWYVNRPRLTPEQMVRGVNDDTGPAPGTWAVSRKSNGVSPGFTISDSRGARYFIKFDPPGLPELGTGAEVLVTRLYHALGYHTAQTNIGTLRREQLTIAKDATVRLLTGGRRPLTQSDIDEQLSRAHRNADGSYRAVFSQALPGRPVEGFLDAGTRSDDPNDVVPHENRRELRALRVFGAWVNHTDAKPINSLDTVVTENSRSFVRHHVIDFNAALGSAGIGLRDRRDGYEYLVEFGPARTALPSFGLAVRPWMTIDYPDIPGVGRFEAKRFVPEQWRSRVPNPAYLRSRPDDTFWGARKLLSLISDDLIHAAVRAGRYSDPRAEPFLTQALIERRDKIARAWLTNVNPIVDPALSADGALTFGNAAVQYAASPAPKGYVVEWHHFDNDTGQVERIGRTEAADARMNAPAAITARIRPETTRAGGGTYIRADIAATGGAHPSWSQPVHAYFRRVADGWKLVGFDRMPGAPPMRPGLVGAEAHRGNAGER